MAGTEALEAQEALPNEPEWIFCSDIQQAERNRLIGDMVAAFKTIFDPEIPCDIYELGLIYKVDVDENRLIRVTMTLTAPGCPSPARSPVRSRPRSARCPARSASL